MDFSPMHPDVWAKTDARRWNYYIALRMAYEDGREEVRRRKGTTSESDKKKKMDELIARAGARR